MSRRDNEYIYINKCKIDPIVKILFKNLLKKMYKKFIFRFKKKNNSLRRETGFIQYSKQFIRTSNNDHYFRYFPLLFAQFVADWLFHITSRGKRENGILPEFLNFNQSIGIVHEDKTRVMRYLRILSLKKKSNISFLVYLQTSPYFNVFQNNKQCIYNDKNKWENHPEWHFLHETRRNSWKMKTTTKKKIWRHFFDK